MSKINKCLFKAFCCLFVLQTGSFVFAAKKAKVTVPEWVELPSSVYPKESYVTYVGTAADRNAAEVAALRGLASIFGQSVKSEANSSSRMLQAKADGLVANSSVQSFSEDIKRTIDVDCLIGVETRGYWFDNNATWYAIAVLDKSQATDIYSDMIRKNAEAMEVLFKTIRSDKKSFESYASYDFAEDIACENEDHLKKLAIINPSVVDSLKQACPSSKEIHSKKMALANEIPICVVTEGDVDGRFKEAFSQAITACGFKGSYDTSVRYVLVAKANFDKAETSDKKTVKCRYSLESYILDTELQHQIVPYSATGRDSMVTYEEARVKSVRKLEEKIKTEYKEKLSEYLRNLKVE